MADLSFGLAKSAVEGTITVVKAAIDEENKLQKNVQRDLKLISDELEMMNSFLHDSNGKDHVVTDAVGRTVVRQMRNMALDVEDCIDDVLHLDGKSRWWRRVLPSCLPAAKPAAALDAAVAEMEVLKGRVEAMGQRNLRYGRIGDHGSNSSADQTTHQQVVVANSTASNIVAAARDAAGKQSNQVDLVKLINHEELNSFVSGDGGGSTDEEDGGGLHSSPTSPTAVLQVISVFGSRNEMGIMSIKKAYDHPETCNNFRCRAWVKLMHPFNPHEFIRSLLAQFYKNYYSEQEGTQDVLEPTKVMMAPDTELIEEFKRQMNNHKYLVVLEDLSTMVDWEAVRVYLPDKNNGSCVVVHTQQAGIASLCVGHPHRVSELKKFSDEHSVYAFKKKNATGYAFKKDPAENDEAQADKRLFARLWINEHPPIGRDTELFLLRPRLDPRHVASGVFSVWGMRGVGKSFIVKHVYYRMIQLGIFVRSGFKFGWVDVPRPFDLMDMSQKLLLDLNPGYQPHRIMSTVEDPIQECREYLHEHKCYIVIDGLRSTKEWDLMKDAFGLRSGDCVVVITNEESVAKHCVSEENYSLFNIRGLNFDSAIDLFTKKVEWNIIETNEEERHIIVQKCGGLPKVISAAANILSRPWLESSLKEEKFASVLEANALHITESLDDLFAWLHSYIRFYPYFLKPCIFYLSIFPRNHTIRRRRLLRRWIAEGYARDNNERTAEQNGEISFDKLVKESMIQLPERSSGRTPLCHVNGFVREYIISRSMDENLVFALEGRCSKNLQRTGRHLTIDKSWDRDQNVFEGIEFSRLRSLTVFGDWKSFFVSDKMRLLRVLDLENVSSGTGTEGVTNSDVEQMVKLVPRLKFLSLRRCRDITLLPDSLGDLKQLQTLDIRGTRVSKLPKSIRKLDKLQYIRAGTNPTDPPSSDVSNIIPSAPLPSEEIPSALNDPSSDDNISIPSWFFDECIPSSSSPTLEEVIKNRTRAILLPNWLSNKLCKQRQLGQGPSDNGVKVPSGIWKLSNLHTLGVVNISDAAREGTLEELKNLTQLHKLGVSGINRSNSHKLSFAISDLAHLESLLLHVQRENDDSDQDDCLDCISQKTLNKLRSLKLYGLVKELPVWLVSGYKNLTKLSLQITMLPQEGVDILQSLEKLWHLRLFLSEFQDDKLKFSNKLSLGILEISCNTRLQATTTIMFGECTVKVLRIRCWRLSSLYTSGLQLVCGLEEVWLSGPCDVAHKGHFQREVGSCKLQPVLRVEEEGSSTTWLRTST